MQGKSAPTLPGRQAPPPASTGAGLAETTPGATPDGAPAAGALLGEAAATLAACLSIALALALLGRHPAGG